MFIEPEFENPRIIFDFDTLDWTEGIYIHWKTDMLVRFNYVKI